MKIKRIMSVVLVVCILIMSLDHQANAKPLSIPNRTGKDMPKASELQSGVEVLNTFPKPGKSPIELEERRTLYSREYINPDGSFSVEVSTKPVNYRDSNGKLKLIDNTMIKSEQPDYDFVNKANSFKVRMASSNIAGKLVHYSIDQERYLTFSPTEKFTAVGKVKGASLKYRNAKSNMDLKYTVDSNMLKEEIILYEYPNTNTFTFNLESKGISFEKDSDGMLWGRDIKTKERLFRFHPSFAVDAREEVTFDADLNIAENKSKLILTVNDEWLKNAVYPVTIDPTIETAVNGSIQDTYIAKDRPDAEYYWDSYLHVGNLAGYGAMRSMIRFDNLPSLPVGAKITRAEIGAYMYLGSTSGTTIDVHKITQTWKDDITNWNSNISYDSSPILSSFSAAPNTEWKFDITSLASEWYSANAGNYGVMLKATDEASPKLSFYSSEKTGSSPRLIINYEIDPLGTESYFTYDGDVNVFNGNLVVSETDVSLLGRGIPIIVSRTYNSRDEAISTVGKRWRLNIGMNIKFISDDESVVQLTEGDGSKIYFGYKQEDNNQNKIYASPTGIHSTLIKDYSQGIFTLVEKSGITYYFTVDGRLDKIVDNDGNITDLFYNSDSTLNRIQDASGRIVNFSYLNGKLDRISGNEIATVKYTYSGDNLAKVEIKNEADEVLDSIQYGYSATYNNLEEITDKYGHTTAIGYSYTTELGRRVYTIKKPLTIDGVVTYPTTYYNYNDNGSEIITSVTNPEGNITEYTTNYHGNVEKVIHDKGGLNITAQYEWDQEFNIIKVIDPKGKSSVASYTDKGNVARVVNPVNDISNNNFNTYNDMVQSIGFAGESTKHYYDSKRRITGNVDSAYSTTVYNYNSNGQIVSVSNPISIGENRIPNSGFESSGGTIPWRWTKEGAGGSITHDSSVMKNGSYAVKLSSTGTQYNENAILVSDYIEVTPKSRYNVSWYVKTATVGSNGGGATADIRWYDSNHQLLATWANTAPSIDTQGVHNDWLRKGARVDSPADALYAKLVLRVNDLGTAWFDNVQFEYGPVINQYNLLSNESFETDIDNDAKPDGWIYANLATEDGDGVVSDVSHSGNNAVLIHGKASTNKFIYQKINLEGKTGTPVHISGWAKPEGASPTGGDFSLLIQVVFKDGSPDGWYGFDYDKSGSDWEYKATEIRPAKDFSHIAIYAKYENQTGRAWFDDFKIRLNGSSHAFMSAYNIAENGSFELDADNTGWPDGWPVVHSETSGTYSTTWVDKIDGWQGSTEIADEYKPYNGEKMLKMANMPDWAKVNTFFFETIKENATYSASALIKTENVSGSGAVLIFDVYSSSNVYLGQLTSEAITGSADWTRVTLTASYDELKAISSSAAKIKLGIGVSAATSGTMYFDTIRMWEKEIESTFEYDVNDNYMVSATNQLGHKLLIGNDKRGNLDLVTDAKNNAYDYNYDELDRVKQIVNPLGLNSQFAYDVTPTANTVQIDNSDGSGYINTAIKVTYNELGLPKIVKDSNWRDTQLEYDKNTNLTDIKYPDGNIIHYTYDKANRITDINYTGDARTWAFGYDANSNITTENNSGTITSYSYDDLNRLKNIAYPQINGSNHNTTYSYNTVGQVTQVQHSPLGNDSVSYSYNLSGFNTSVRGPNNSEAEFMYNEQSQLKKSWAGQIGNRHYLSYRDYDASGNIIRIWTEDNQGNLLSDITYDTYDQNGNLRVATDRLTGEYTKYDYDAINQLTKEEYYSSNDILTNIIEYKYEGRDGLLGNRTSKTVTQGTAISTINYDYNTANEILSAGGDAYTHDQRGNLTSDGTRTYIYNLNNQLIEVKEGSTTLSQYEYNAAGLRTKKVDIASSKTYYYYYNGNKLAYISDGNNNMMYFFTRDTAGNLLNMIDYTEATAQTYWYIIDGHGSILGMVDKDGDKVVSYKYDAWGNSVSSSSTINTGNGIALDVANPFRYSSYFYDEETDFYYLHTRYYNAELGRFLTRDAVLSNNLYTYCMNNPVNIIDTNGMIAWWIAGAAIGAVVGGIVGAVISYKTNDGKIDWRYVVGGAAGGALVGAGVGWAAHTAMGAGTLGSTLLSNWQESERVIRKAYKAVTKTFDTPYGRRVVDAFSKRVAREVKYGYVSATKFVKAQVAKDAYLLQQGRVKAVEWHFYVSQATGKGGPSGPLLELLKAAGIKVKYH